MTIELYGQIKKPSGALVSELTEKVEPSVGPGHDMGSPTPCECGDDPSCNVGCVHPLNVWAVALTVSLGCSFLWGISVKVALIMRCPLGEVIFLFFLFGFHWYGSPSRITTWFFDDTAILHIHQVPIT